MKIKNHKSSTNYLVFMSLGWGIIMLMKIYAPSTLADSLWYLPAMAILWLWWPFAMVILWLEMKYRCKNTKEKLNVNKNSDGHKSGTDPFK